MYVCGWRHQRGRFAIGEIEYLCKRKELEEKGEGVARIVWFFFFYKTKPMIKSAKSACFLYSFPPPPTHTERFTVPSWKIGIILNKSRVECSLFPSFNFSGYFAVCVCPTVVLTTWASWKGRSPWLHPRVPLHGCGGSESAERVSGGVPPIIIIIVCGGWGGCFVRTPTDRSRVLQWPRTLAITVRTLLASDR